MSATIETKPRGLVCKTPQVLALLNGATQIRVPMKKQPFLNQSGNWDFLFNNKFWEIAWFNMTDGLLKQNLNYTTISPYQSGDVIYVKETWCTIPFQGRIYYEYRADSYAAGLNGENPFGEYWKRSTQMPYEAARIIRTVAWVRVERVQDISTADSYSQAVGGTYGETGKKLGWPGDDYEWDNKNAQEAFSWFYQSLHGPESWERNDWVWVYDLTPATP